MDKKYKEPNIRINKVYTKTGDSGKTRLASGQLRDKDDLRITCYGEIDELNSIIGICIESVKSISCSKDEIDSLIKILVRVQHELFNLGSVFASININENSSLPQIQKKHINQLETEIDLFNSSLESLTSFVLPGGSYSNTWFHLARTVCRRVERNAVSLNKVETLDPNSLIYLNRLSDMFFVFSRWIIKFECKTEVLWNPNSK